MKLDGLHRSLFHPGQRLTCALSGGADSTALLLALLEANAEKASLGVVLSALHVHHGLRGAEADADALFVRELCLAHHIPLSVVHVDTAARQHAEGEGQEEAARELRYAAFRQHLADDRAGAIVTAHTRDDQAETVLMKLLRGAWTEGLSGIAPILPLTSAQRTTNHQPPTTTVVLRPMLAVTRAEVAPA